MFIHYRIYYFYFITPSFFGVINKLINNGEEKNSIHLKKFIKETAPTSVTTGQAGLDNNPPGSSKRFRGAKVFKVPTSTFLRARLGKKKYAPYRKILGEIENGEEIRQYGLKHYNYFYS